MVMDGYYLGDGAGAGDLAPAHSAATAAKLTGMAGELAYTADSTTWRLKNRVTLTGAGPPCCTDAKATNRCLVPVCQVFS